MRRLRRFGSIWIAALLVAPPTPVRAGPASASGMIAFSRDGDVYVVQPDGTGRTRLTGGSAFDYAIWSPDGTMLAVIRCCPRRDPSAWAIRVMNADGTGKRTIIDEVRHSIQHAAWSPDGTRIAFSDMQIDDPDAPAPYPAAIVVVATDGSGRSRLTGYAAGNGEPTWSPDGSRIAYSRGDGENSEIYVMNADGTGKRRLTDNGVNDFEPRWSPDGTEILYTTAIPAEGGGDAGVMINVMAADGTFRRALTDGSRYDRTPRWSPDGSAVLFVGLILDEPFDVGLWVVGADGTGARRLAATDFSPAWSPDGIAIVFPFQGNIHVIGADGIVRTRVVGGRAWDTFPDWQALPTA